MICKEKQIRAYTLIHKITCDLDYIHNASFNKPLSLLAVQLENA